MNNFDAGKPFADKMYYYTSLTNDLDLLKWAREQEFEWNEMTT